MSRTYVIFTPEQMQRLEKLGDALYALPGRKEDKWIAIAKQMNKEFKLEKYPNDYKTKYFSLKNTVPSDQPIRQQRFPVAFHVTKVREVANQERSDYNEICSRIFGQYKIHNLTRKQAIALFEGALSGIEKVDVPASLVKEVS